MTTAARSLPGVFANWNLLDWGLAVLVGSSVVTAAIRGLICSLVSASGVLLGVMLAAWYAPALAIVLRRWLPAGPLSEIVAFLLIVAGTYLLAVLLGKVLRGAARTVGLGFFDRLGGAMFGFGRAVLVLAAVLIPLRPFLSTLPLTRDSVLLPYLQTAAHGVSFVMPQDFGQRLLEYRGRHGAVLAPPERGSQRQHKLPLGEKHSEA